MQTTHACIMRGFAARCDEPLKKTASLRKEAERRWLEDGDLVKLCRLCKSNSNKKRK